MLDRTPSFPGYDARNSGLIDTKVLSDGLISLSSRCHRTNFSYIGRRQLCISSRPNTCNRVPGTACMKSPTLRETVTNILFLGTQKEMVRSNTRRVVAAVANNSSWGDRPEMHLKRKAMCSNGFMPRLKHAISALYCGLPNPATFRLGNFGPKSIFNRLHNRTSVTLRGTILHIKRFFSTYLAGIQSNPSHAIGATKYNTITRVRRCHQ